MSLQLAGNALKAAAKDTEQTRQQYVNNTLDTSTTINPLQQYTSNVMDKSKK